VELSDRTVSDALDDGLDGFPDVDARASRLSGSGDEERVPVVSISVVFGLTWAKMKKANETVGKQSCAFFLSLSFHPLENLCRPGDTDDHRMKGRDQQWDTARSGKWQLSWVPEALLFVRW
jgi:hypothetical protein